MDFSSLFPCSQNSISHILNCSTTRTWSMISAPAGPDQKNPSDVSTLPANWNILRCPILIFPGIHARNVIPKTKMWSKKGFEDNEKTKTILLKTSPLFIKNMLWINLWASFLDQCNHVILLFPMSSNSSTKNQTVILWWSHNTIYIFQSYL